MLIVADQFEEQGSKLSLPCMQEEGGTNERFPLHKEAALSVAIKKQSISRSQPAPKSNPRNKQALANCIKKLTSYHIHNTAKTRAKKRMSPLAPNTKDRLKRQISSKSTCLQALHFKGHE
jgi:hypothetical protein